ncbi:hypothetical protein J3Q64DRAFT_1694309 [Phycomyces blakesleeanus]|uniref:E3 ubiquitin-protein ligase listerin n=1 Tax=Phycomyces blakesleeanus TaxID=4837 RepID=A0ABR3BI57_PHYBL
MVKPGKQPRVKGNMKPASSSRAAELSGSTSLSFDNLGGFAQFANAGIPNASNNTLHSSTPTTEDHLDPGLSVILKKVAKRDMVTKLKALEELEAYLKAHQESIPAILSTWVTMYGKLTMEVDRRVRLAANSVHALVTSQAGKKLAPHLKDFVGPWMMTQFDQSRDVARAAKTSFETVFSEEKRAGVLLFCQKDILEFIIEMLLYKTPETLSDPRYVTKEDMDAKFARVISSNIYCISYLIGQLPIEDRKKSSDVYDKLFDDPVFWKYVSHQSPMIRNAVYSLIKTLLLLWPDILKTRLELVCPVFFAAVFNEKDGSTHSSMWDALLLITKKFPESWIVIAKKKSAIPKLCNFLRSGLNGSVGISYPSILALLANLPKELKQAPNFYKDVFDSLWKSLSTDFIDSSNSHIFLNSYVECAVYFIVMESKNEDENTKPIVDYLINTVLWRPYELFFIDVRGVSGHEKLDIKNYLILAKHLSVLVSSDSVKDLMEPFWTLLDNLLSQTITDCSTKLSKSIDLENLCYKAGGFMMELCNELNKIEKSGSKDAMAHASKLARRLLLASIKSSITHKDQSHALLILADQLLSSYSNELLDTDEHSKEILVSSKELLTLITQGPQQSIGSLVAFYTKLVFSLSEKPSKELWNSVISMLKELNGKTKDSQAVLCQSQVMLLLLEQIKKEGASMDYKSEELDSLVQSYASQLLDSENTNEFLEVPVIRETLERILASTISLNSVHPVVSEDTLKKLIASLQLTLKNFNGFQYIIKSNSSEPSTKLTQITLSSLKVLYDTITASPVDTLPAEVFECLPGEVFDAIFSKNSVIDPEAAPIQTVADMASLVWDIMVAKSNGKTLIQPILKRVKSSINNISFFASPSDSAKRVQKLLSSVNDNIRQESMEYLFGTREEWKSLARPFEQHTRVFSTLAIQDPLAGLVNCSLVDDDDELLPVSYDLYGLSAYGRTALFAAEYIFSNSTNLSNTTDWIMIELMVARLACQSGLEVPGLCRVWDNKIPESALGIQAFVHQMDKLFVKWIDDLTTNASFNALSLLNDLKQKVKSEYDSRLKSVLMELLSTPALSVATDFSPKDVYLANILEMVLRLSLQNLEWSTDDVAPWTSVLKAESTELSLLGKVATMMAFKETMGESPMFKNLQSDLVSKLSSISNLEDFQDSHKKPWSLLVLLNISSLKFKYISIPTQRLMHLMLAMRKWFTSKSSPDTEQAMMHVQIAQLFSHLAESLQDVSGGQWSLFLGQCYEWVAIQVGLTKTMWVEQFSDPTVPEEITLLYYALLFYKQLEEMVSDGNSELENIIQEYAPRFSKTCLKLLTLEKGVNMSHPRQKYQELLADLHVQIPDNILFDALSFTDMCHLLKAPTEQLQKCSYDLLRRSISHTVEELSVRMEFTETSEGDTDFSINRDIYKSLVGAPDMSTWHSANLKDQPLHEILGFLLSWLLMFDHFNEITFKLKQEYTSQLKDADLISTLLPVLFKILGTGYTQDIKPFDLAPWDIDSYDLEGFESTSEISYLILASHLYFRALKQVPSLVRAWWVGCKNRQLILGVESYTEKYFSPRLINNELDMLNRPDIMSDLADNGDNTFTVKALKSANEVMANYLVDDQTLSVCIKLPKTYPLRQINVEGVAKIGVNEKQWRGWMFAVSAVIGFQNGNIADALTVFKRNANLHFEGVEDCTICYSIINVIDRSIPNKQCRTCKNKFHSNCLYKVT